MNRVNTVLNLKIPNKVRNDLTPDFISKRISEIIGIEEYLKFQQNYYKYIYVSFMSEVGFPIRDVYTDKVPHEVLKIGDVIVIEEIGNYSRIYQRVPNSYGFLILEQFADKHSNPEMIIWKTRISQVPPPVENVGIYVGAGELIMGLNILEINDQHLHRYFINYLNNQKRYYVDNLLNRLPKDKAEVIRNYNPDWEGMVEKLWSDLISVVQD